MNNKKITKHMSFPAPVVQVLEKEGEKLGYSFTEFAKYILTQKAEEYKKNAPYEEWSPKAQSEFLKRVQEYKSNKKSYTTFKSPKDLLDHLDNL